MKFTCNLLHKYMIIDYDCYPQVFAEIFDPVIKDRHNGYDPTTMKHPTDLDSSKVKASSCVFVSEPLLKPFSIKNMQNETYIEH